MRCAVQIISSLSFTNPVPNVTVGISGAIPDPSTGKVPCLTLLPHVPVPMQDSLLRNLHKGRVFFQKVCC